jgi:hypothetical protein
MPFGHVALAVAAWISEAKIRASARHAGLAFLRPRNRSLSEPRRGGGAEQRMKRIATWVFYAVGALAIAYLALYAYATFSGRHIVPGDPIHIFRNPDAPSYS